MTYVLPPPSTLLNHEVEGQVSHVDADCFWLQMEPDKVARLTLCRKEENMRQGEVPQLEEGDSVVGWWEGDLYRGVIIKILEEVKVLVRFVDWGNMATLARDMVRKAFMVEVETVVGAVKCNLLGRDLLAWTKKLEQCEYMVKLKCVAMYQDTYMMTETISSPLLPTQEDNPGTVTHVCEDRSSLWFCPATSQSALDILMDKLDQVSNNLTPLAVSHVFPGQLCAAMFTADGGMYRAMVIEMGEQAVSVFYIDYGDRELKDKAELWMLPEELLAMPPAVVKVDTGGKTVTIEQEDKLVGEEVVLRMVEDDGRTIAKFFIGSKEISFLSGIVQVDSLPLGIKIGVILGHVETVREVWVTPLVKVHGVEACVEMVDKILDLLASKEQLVALESTQPGQVAVARFSEDELLYRCRVDEDGMVKFIDFGNGEPSKGGVLYEMPEEVEDYPAGAFKVNIEMEASVANTEENMVIVEEKLGGENIVLVMEEGGVATFYRGEEHVKFFETAGGEEKKVLVPKGCIIEISMSDDEEIEVSDGEEAQTEANPKIQAAVPVTVNHVENVSTVWITRATMYSALDRLVDQLAEMEGQLSPLANVEVGVMVLARFTEDGELYRGKVISVANQVATVLFIDFGESEQQPVDSFMELPVQFRDLEPLAERVKLEGVEMLTESEECREMVDKRLNKEGISMMLNEKSEAIFLEKGEKIEFSDLNNQTDGRESSMTGWKAGDKVAYMTADLVWRRGVIMMFRQDQVKVMGEEGLETMADIRHVKSAEMPLEALNKLEEDMIKSVHLHHGEPGDEGHLPHGEGGEAPVEEISPVKHLTAMKILDVDEDIPTNVLDEDKDTPAKMLDVDESPSASTFDDTEPATPACSLPPTTASAPARSVFTPTATLTQQVVTDWIASCLHIINTKEVAKYKEGQEESICSGLLEGSVKKEEINKTENKGSNPAQTNTSVPVVSSRASKPSSVSPSTTSDPTILSPLDFLTHCQTPAGSERIKNLLTSGNEMARARILQSVLSCDLMEMLSSPLSCQVVQKLLSCLDPDMRDQLAIPIIKQMRDLAVHSFGHQAVLALLAVGSQDQRDMLSSQLERENTLLDLLKDKQGSFVVQRCLPYLKPGTVTSIVSSLESSVVEVGCHPHSSFFLQEFFRMFSGQDRVDILQDKVMDNLEMMLYNQVGHWVVQTVIKLGHPRHITMATTWFENNMQEAVLDSTAVFVARTLVQQLLARSRKGVENTWSLAMDKLVWKMMDTMVVSQDASLPLFIVAAMHHAGHILVQEVVRQKDWLGHSKGKMMTILEQNRLRLRVDTFGCLVVKGFEGWM